MWIWPSIAFDKGMVMVMMVDATIGFVVIYVV